MTPLPYGLQLLGYRCDGCRRFLEPSCFAASDLPGGDNYKLDSTFCLDCLDSSDRTEEPA